MCSPAAWRPLPQSWRDRAFAELDTVLLESTLPSLEQHHSYLFCCPVRMLIAAPADLDGFFGNIEECLAEGLHLAGFLTYEAGLHLHGLPAHPLPPGLPLGIFGAYRAPEIFDHLCPSPIDQDPIAKNSTTEHPPTGLDGAPLNLAMMPTLSREQYARRIAQIQNWIEAGDTYQVNFTMQLASQFTGTPDQIYRRLAGEQPSSFTAVARLGTAPAVLSFSPELFFERDADGRILTRPMKGTAPRLADTPADALAAAALQADAKNRAEHVMIVDLLRNDLGRICQMGSVHVEDLFRVETYPTVHQMVSSVGGQLAPHLTWLQIFQAIFPSGSITGAPKRHTMELVHQLEPTARGVYTGAIGHIHPDGRAAFSVAIRTLLLDATHRRVTMGVGSGVVADSRAAPEYHECLLKASFLSRGSVPLQLLETMRAHDGQIPLLARHMSRLRSSADALGFPFDLSCLLTQLQQSTPAHGSWRLRLTLAADGTCDLTVTPVIPWPATLRILLSTTKLWADDPALRHKTTFRPIYDQELHGAQLDGFDEVIFCNTAGQLTEGCISNLLVRQGSRLLTPPLYCGVLPGIYRDLLLGEGQAEEAALAPDDLRSARHIFLCNSVRGMGAVAEIRLANDDIVYSHDARQERWSHRS